MDDVEMPTVPVAFVMGVSEASRDSRNDKCSEVYRHLFPELAVTLDELLQVNSPHKFHHHKILPANLAEMVGLNDVGVD
jgi:hypothetical protein